MRGSLEQLPVIRPPHDFRLFSMRTGGGRVRIAGTLRYMPEVAMNSRISKLISPTYGWFSRTRSHISNYELT